MEIDTGLLRAFLAIAEEQNLTRAAQRLAIAQPALSKQLRKLETQLHAELFTRGRHGAQLTPAGEALIGPAQAALAAWETAQRRVRIATRAGRPVLCVGFIANAAAEHTPAIAARFTQLRPDMELDFRQIDWSDPTGGLSSGISDVALLRLPVPEASDLALHPLFSEPMYLAVPAHHHLARQPSVTVADTDTEKFVATRGPQAWRDWWLAAGQRGGRPVNIGAVVGTPDEWLAAILTGRGISFAFASAASYYAPPGITYLPVTDLVPSTVAVAHRQDTRNPAVDTFIAASRQAIQATGKN